MYCNEPMVDWLNPAILQVHRFPGVKVFIIEMLYLPSQNDPARMVLEESEFAKHRNLILDEDRS